MTRPLLLRGHVWFAAAVVPLLVRVLPIRSLVRAMTPPRWLHLYRQVPAEQMAAVVSHRLRKPRVMRRRACLRHGLVLFHVLKLAGYPAMLHFGVYPPSRDPRRLHGHCWITVGDVCLSEPPSEPAAVVMTCCGEDPKP
jgi:hypothetical protein